MGYYDKNRVIILYILCFCNIIVFVESGITLSGTKCGQKICQIGEYCNEIHGVCESCANICDSSGLTAHNFDKQTCEEKCQDYLHDQKYVQKGNTGDEAELKATVTRLSKMVTVTLSLVCFILVVLACIFCFQLYRWKVKKHITLDMIRNKFFKKSSESNESPSTPKNTSRDDKKRDLRLDMPSPTVNSEHSPVTVSTSISRRPAEDSTLDYAYDNPAMTR